MTREGLPIDTAGVLADGTKVDGPVALRQALLARPEVFVGTITEKMLIYALGRGLEPIDMPVVRGIVRNASPPNYAMQSIVLGIVRSAPFQMSEAAVPVRGDLRAQRDLPAAVASGDDRQRFRLQADHGAARAVSAAAGDDQRDEGA